MKRLLRNPMVWVISTLLVALLPQFAAMPPQLVLLALAPVGWRFAAELRGWKPLPTLLRLAFTLVTLAVLIGTYGNLLGRRAAVGLLSLMLALKLLETFRIRDARIVASLALFLCATQFLFNQGMLMIVYGTACMLLALGAFTLLARSEAFTVTRQPAPAGQGLFTELGFGSRLMLVAVPLGLALFLFFPRWGTPLWGVPERSLDAKSGLSDSMSPGSIQGLFMDDSPAFRAEFRGAVPPPAERYWRGPVMWDFDGVQWEATRWRNGIAAETTPAVSEADYFYEIQLEPHERRWLFTLDFPAFKPPEAHRLTFDYQLLTRRPVTQLLTYELASDPDFYDSPQLRLPLRQAALELPEGFNPRTQALMEEWRAETPGDAALVRRALAHFNEAPFRYTLNPPLLSRHSVDEFLFDTRAGFCEHYASAFAIMMRMAGIPARIVTGYQGGWYNDRGNYLLVRQSDAHAWAEVWLPDVGWTRIDPTAAVAPSRVENGSLDALDDRRHLLDFAWLREVRNGFDWMNRAWNDWIIAFDAARQSRLLGVVGIEKIGARTLVVLLAIAMVLSGLVMIPWLRRLSRNRETDPVVKAWRRVIERLASAGLAVTPSMGPLEVAAAAHGQERIDADRFNALAQDYLRVRYASETSGRAALIRALKAFRPGRPTRRSADFPRSPQRGPRSDEGDEP